MAQFLYEDLTLLQRKDKIGAYNQKLNNYEMIKSISAW